MKIVVIAGIRPDFIRLSMLIKKLQADPNVEFTLIHSGQHFDKNLSGAFFTELSLPEPHFNLECSASTPYEQLMKLVPRLISTLNSVIADKREKHWVVYLGDSNSVLSAPFVKKEGFRVAHIEALMRSFDPRMQEEINRRCCDEASDLLLTYNYEYLKYASNMMGKAVVCGNTIVEPVREVYPDRYSHSEQCHILVDIHRPENFLHKDRLEWIAKFIKSAKDRLRVPVLFLKFKRTIKAIEDYGITSFNGFEHIDLVGFREHLELQKNAICVISDSGTDQEQCCLLNTPVFVPRDFTEREVSVRNECSVMITPESDLTPNEFEQALRDMKHSSETYWLYDGIGHTVTSSVILNALKGN